VLLCDDRPAARRELTTLLTSRSAAIRVIATAAPAAMIHEFGSTPADVVMLGLHQGSGSGVTSVTQLLEPHPTALVIVYGPARDTALLIAAVTGGARGLMIWDTGHRPHHITQLFLQPGAHRRPGPGSEHSGRRAATLTVRELQILQGMSDGRSNGAIGRELHLSEDTVKTHARRLFNKIGALDRAHAVALGLRAGLL
jgi:DNA-binding NarL/FixJ family response regulator